MPLTPRAVPALSTLAAALAASIALVSCGSDSTPASPSVDATPVAVKLIALNDFHGNLEPPAATSGGSVVVADPATPAGKSLNVGGIAYLASLVKELKAANPNNVVVGAGDMVGASPFVSSFMHDEPTVDALNQLGLEVTAVGNHEFDGGSKELQRMQNGGCFAGGTVGTDTCLSGGVFAGASYKYLAANVVATATGQTLFPATWVKQVGTVKVGFVGLTFKDTPTAVTPTGVAGLTFTDEVATINDNAAKLKAQGADAVVVLIHQGGTTTASLLNDLTCPGLSGDILAIVDKLSKDVDVVVSGHTHREYVCKRNGKLLTQTGFYGAAVTEIDLTIKPGTGVTSAVANTRPVVQADNNTGVPAGFRTYAKDTAMAALVQKYVDNASVIGKTPIGSITATIRRANAADGTSRNSSIESPLGDLLADSYLAATSGTKNPATPAVIALTNPGGIRADLTYVAPSGVITYGDVRTVSPFRNYLVTLDLTGQQLLRILEQQWEGANGAFKDSGGTSGFGRLLQVSSGLTYTVDTTRPVGSPAGQGNRVIASTLALNGKPIDLAATYRVTTNNFLAAGGDNFTGFTAGRNVQDYGQGIIDADATIAYIKAKSPIAPPAADRIKFQ